MSEFIEKSFEKTSYQSHENWFEKQYPESEIRLSAIKKWLNDRERLTIGYWLHKRLFDLSKPILRKNETWLTVGDGYGFDGNFLKMNNCKVVATDIGGSFLPISKQENLIDDYSIENVEKLSFNNNTFDYTFCKESFHHFPRAYLGVYEMIRVSKKGVILIEPQDPLSKMPLMLAIKNILDRYDVNILQKFWKNRYSFEEVGNYVFKLSEREMEKLAMGMNLPAIAFKGINNFYWNNIIDTELANKKNKVFRKISVKLKIDNLLCWLGIMPYHVLSVIIFKSLPDPETILNLKKDGYIYYVFPKNPYL